ncbi:tetratricopeptide repeat protein [Candidatus Ruthturnera calyptogenae]|uniref:tetratricopeptide repeat protein n=1 Tax=Candidatus Ruthturnera calyptogenae TaxID=386487 RepID=UPI0004660313|nr:SEL1-like repeat protein [Candidatus Ruthturnera calyptogenae]
MIKLIYLVLLFSFPIQALQILQPINDNQAVQQQLEAPQLNAPLSVKQLLTQLKKSAKLGDARSQFSLANMYHNGINVIVDDKLAFYWYLQVAEQGYVSAQFNVANSYYYALGTDKDLEQALHWYKKSALLGYRAAQLNLAKLYDVGIGVDRDLTLAQRWYEAAANQFDPEAQFYLADFYEREGDSSKALDYYKKSANQGFVNAQVRLSALYRIGYLVKQSDIKALYWTLIASNQTVKLLKKLSSKSQKVVQNKQEKSVIHQSIIKPIVIIEPIMVKTPQQSTINLNEQLFSNIDRLIPSQDEISKSLNYNTKLNTNLEIFLTSVGQNNPIVQYNLSALYSKDGIVRKDNRAAFILMRQSANQGIIQSQNILAIMYMNGIGVQIDHNKAYYWANVTAQKGSQQGKRILLYLIANL